jgi:hypothetical protein
MGPFGGYLAIDNCALALPEFGKIIFYDYLGAPHISSKRGAGIKNENNYQLLQGDSVLAILNFQLITYHSGNCTNPTKPLFPEAGSLEI